MINDKSNLASIQGAPAPTRNKNHFSPGPAIVKNRNRRINLQRRKSVVDLSNDNYYDYSLPWEGQFSQTNETNIKIVSVQGSYSQEEKAIDEKQTQEYMVNPMSHTYFGTKQEHNNGTEIIGDKLRKQTFEEIKSADPENISLMMSNLSLDPMNYMEPGEIGILKNILKSNF